MTPGPSGNGFELLRAELRAFHAELKHDRAETAASFREQLAAVEAGIRQDLAAAEGRLRDEIIASQAETRRHMAVIAEELIGKIELVGEGVRGVDERLEVRSLGRP